MTLSEAEEALAAMPEDEREAAEERIAIRIADGMSEAKAVVMTVTEYARNYGHVPTHPIDD